MKPYDTPHASIPHRQQPHQSMPLFSNYTQTQQTYSPEGMLGCWQCWADLAQPGSGEKREIAVSRLCQCLDNNMSRLDLCGLDLKDVPFVLPPCVNSLVLSHNKLTQLPALPEHLICLAIDNNYLTWLPRLPACLEVLFACKNRIVEITAPFPDTLRQLYLINNPLTRLPPIFPHGLEDIYLSGNFPLSMTDMNHTVAQISLNKKYFWILVHYPGCSYLHLSANRISLKQ